ncbi:ferric reductase [Jannaschia pagri]|uniref:Ferric reductase n=1 Tax=Jannaschia pagri TaxID=2829797 RepID=A0ABQ4NR06_9RHOB|nr:ferric reductase-like transmembrane domain-containing protein [Jannaschia sp. AI_61]GIT96846.1 ferric reductase [Jannaschia sp. AI_62]
MIRNLLIWGTVAIVLIWPMAVAATSPLLAWRDSIYIAAGLSGVFGLALMTVQPLLARGVLPGLDGLHGRRWHRWGGALLLLTVALHIGGLWLTSPPDVIDALTLRSPTPFSVWGVIALWALGLAGTGALVRDRMPPRVWRRVHLAATTVAVTTTVIHAMLIVGTMGTWSKVALSGAALLALGHALYHSRIGWRRGR